MHHRSTIVSHHHETTTSPAATTSLPQQQQQQQQRVLRRKKVIRRHETHLEDVKSLLVVAVLVSFLTASLVWLGTQLYSLAVSRQAHDQVHFGHGGHLHHHNNNPAARATGRDGPAAAAAASSAQDDDYDALPWNPIYHIPEAMEIMGDRSDEYALLRKEMDEILPVDKARSLQRVQDVTSQYPSLRTQAMGVHHSDQIREIYDIYNCPEEPPAGYPFEWKLVDEVLDNWAVNDIEHTPSKIHQGLCVFDFEKDYEKAVLYRKAELPFVVVNGEF